MTNSATKKKKKNPKMATFHKVIFLISPSGSGAGEVLEFAGPKPPLVSQARLWLSRALHGADFHTTPSVPVHARVKFEHFVYPLRVESDINKKRRLRWGAFRPLDAHADDDFALMFLANQWTTIVFLRGKGRERHIRETAGKRGHYTAMNQTLHV